MNSENNLNPLPAFHGSVQKATYVDPLVTRYKGNPAIEALPQILSPERAAQLLAYYPKKEPAGHKLPPEIRMHLIMEALHFFEPLPIHIDLEQRLSRVIRDGYVGRNPVDRDHWREIDHRAPMMLNLGAIPVLSSNVVGFSIIGMPGTGKTTGVERILQTYPQVIHHQSYRGQNFSRTQLVWLKLTCPHDGSIKGLCLDFFREVDGILGSNHHHDYSGGGRRTVDELIPSMCRVGWIHSLGLLAIDEIQHLNQAKSGGAEKMLNFFLQLMNTLGLPVVLIGTYAAMEILSREFRQIRRNCGQGDLIWDRMANDDVWRLFAESLWKYQYTKAQTSINQEFSDALYEESAGIVDFAVKIFLLAQIRAISTGVEKMTPAIIRSVAQDSFKTAQPALRAIRTGDMRAVATMTDLHPIDFESAVQTIRKSALIEHLPSASRLVSDLNTAGTIQSISRSSRAAPPGYNEVMRKTGPAKSQVKARRSAKAEVQAKCLLVQLAQAGLSTGISPHDALVNAGLIKPLFEIQNARVSL